MSCLISPTEHDALALCNGVSSSIPEKYGVDFLILTPVGKCGIQRKKFPEDLFASIKDGRLTRELMLMKQLDYKVLVPEGKQQYDPDGYLISEGNSRWTRSSLRNLLRSIKTKHGVDVEWSDNIQDTISIVSEWEGYLKSGKEHRSLLTRHKNRELEDEWGMFNKRDWARFFLQGFPNIGSKTAEAIYDHFGKIPMEWTCTETELRAVKGIGAQTANMLLGLFK